MLDIQQYLQEHSFASLIKEHGIYPSFNKSGDLVSLNYDQIESLETDILAQQCRGLILARQDAKNIVSQHIIADKEAVGEIILGNSQIIAFPFARFFNLGQEVAAKINWDDLQLKIWSKIDGTLIICYYNPITSSWNVATRSVPEADVPLNGGELTFGKLFNKALINTIGVDFNSFTRGLKCNYTYMFEVVSPYNRVVVNYPETKTFLLGARDLISLQEINPQDLNLGLPLPNIYSYHSIPALIDLISTMNPSQEEGAVAVDACFRRVKIKSPAYVAMHKLRDNLGSSDRNCLDLILQGKEDDAISFLPAEIVINLKQLKVGLIQVAKYHDELYDQLIAEQPDRKTFALQLNKDYNKWWHAPLFARYGGKCISTMEFILNNKKEGAWGATFLDHILYFIKTLGKISG